MYVGHYELELESIPVIESRVEEPETFGEYIRKLRMLKGWSQKELANRIVTRPETIVNWEKGQHTPQRKTIPKLIKVLDGDPWEAVNFDGVLTDNRVWVDADGRELVAANRSDGWGIARLKEAGVRIVVFSTETNPVVTARCEKLGIEVFQGLDNKAETVKSFLLQEKIDSGATIFVGNDENDIPTFPLVGCAIVVGDAHSRAKSQADFVLKSQGGYGAVREICDRILAQMEAK